MSSHDPKLLVLLDRLVTAPPGERLACGHMYAQKTLNHGVPTISVWGTVTTSSYTPRVIDVETAWEMVNESDLPDSTVERFGGTLADFKVTIEDSEVDDVE